MFNPTNIWCNAAFPPQAMEILSKDLAPYQLVLSQQLSQSNLAASGHDLLLAESAIAFGQPDPVQVIRLPQIKWVHLTSAGYTRYDTEAFKAAIKSRSGMVTNSSGVFAEPCAEHALAMIMALARQLPQAMGDQQTNRKWPSEQLRTQSKLLSEQSILIYGFGSIARELVKFLKPLGVKITGVRRHAVGDEGVPIVTAEGADVLLPRSDHVMSILPASAHTENFFDAKRLGRMSQHSYFYNIGRGTTVDQNALHEALSKNQIGGAYLDVTVPEPLPPDHPLWQLPNCWITPHAAGGHLNEPTRLVKHFRLNLERYSSRTPLLNRVM